MQVRQVIAASLLAVTALGAMSQEIDPGENLQGRSLAAQREKAQALAGAREASGVEAQGAEAVRHAKLGEDAEAAAGKPAPASQHAQDKTRSKVRWDLTRWHLKHKAAASEQG